MKKLIVLVGLMVVLAGSCLAQTETNAVSTNLPPSMTYTNGVMSPRMPYSDELWKQLRFLRAALGETNTALAVFATNYVGAFLKPEASAKIQNLRHELAQKVWNGDADEVKLLRIQAILNEP